MGLPPLGTTPPCEVFSFKAPVGRRQSAGGGQSGFFYAYPDQGVGLKKGKIHVNEIPIQLLIRHVLNGINLPQATGNQVTKNTKSPNVADILISREQCPLQETEDEHGN